MVQHAEHIKHIPNGSQCVGCNKTTEDCSKLPFKTYRKMIDRFIEGDTLYVVVVCEEY